MQLTMSLKREQEHLVQELQDAREDATLYMAMCQAAIREQLLSAKKRF